MYGTVWNTLTKSNSTTAKLIPESIRSLSSYQCLTVMIFTIPISFSLLWLSQISALALIRLSGVFTDFFWRFERFHVVPEGVSCLPSWRMYVDCRKMSVSDGGSVLQNWIFNFIFEVMHKIHLEEVCEQACVDPATFIASFIFSQYVRILHEHLPCWLSVDTFHFTRWDIPRGHSIILIIQCSSLTRIRPHSWVMQEASSTVRMGTIISSDGKWQRNQFSEGFLKVLRTLSALYQKPSRVHRQQRVASFTRVIFSLSTFMCELDTKRCSDGS